MMLLQGLQVHLHRTIAPEEAQFNQLLFDILVRFRAFKINLTADLEKAFLQVSGAECDHNYLPFLWVKDATREDSDLQVFRFTRVVFGLSPSLFLLNATV